MVLLIVCWPRIKLHSSHIAKAIVLFVHMVLVSNYLGVLCDFQAVSLCVGITAITANNNYLMGVYIAVEQQCI